jgi:hypothetical protein
MSSTAEEALAPEEIAPKPKRAPRRRSAPKSSPKPSRASAKKKPPVSDKLAICLKLFLAALALNTLMALWVGKAIQNGPSPLTLELGPAEPCFSAGTNADIKAEEREGLQRDDYFIPTYAFLFLSLGLVMFCATGPEWRWSIVMFALTLLAAQCDLFENTYLDACLEGNRAAAPLAFAWSRWKWSLLGLTTASAAPLFLVRTDSTRRIGFVLAAAGAIGLLVFIPTGREELLARYLLSPVLGLSILSIAGSFVADLAIPAQRAAHWK